MADKVTQERYVEINLGFADEDTRKIKIPNAYTSTSEYTTTKFNELDQALRVTLEGTEYGLVVGDRNGADFTGILTGDVIATQKVDFDITN